MNSGELLDPLIAASRFRIRERPAPELDRALEATERCLARHGLRRTTMSDIAREMGVSRPTLYKQLSSIEEATALAAARRVYEFLDQMTVVLSVGAGPQTFIEIAVRGIAFARSNPVVERILRHEPELVGAFITSGEASKLARQVTDLMTPILQAAADAGVIRGGDARLTAELILRLGATLVSTPSSENAEQILRHALEPVLTPLPANTQETPP